MNSRSVGHHSQIPLVSPALWAWSLLFCLCPFLSLCPSLSSRIKHNVFSIGWLLPSPSLAGSQTWVSSTISVRSLTFGRQPLLPHSMGREQGWGHLRATLRFGVYWFIPLLLSKPIFDNLLYREDFHRSTQGRYDLSSCGVVRLESWRLEGVRIWKLSRTYHCEKPPSLSVLTHRCSLATRKPTQHLLAIPYILVSIRAPYESGWPSQFHLPRNYGSNFNSKFL